ncbi:stage III sporulation protein AG [Bacillus sp. JJ722]|uniref:stage III sporulation protein AG n=1 Tax=Bacillus sp. JJ722 TaxID=3122973 RepID=UPI0030001D0E
MKDNNPFMKWIKKVLKKEKQPNDEEQTKKPSLYLYMLVVLVLGVVFMMGSEFLTKNSKTTSTETALPVFKEEAQDVETFGQKSSKAEKTIADYERTFENQIKEALETIAGVKDVTVVVNVDATEKKIYEKNRVTQKQITDETDREGGKRTVEDSSTDEQIVIVRNGEKEVPIVQVTEKPVVRGVLVVAKGADNITVKKWIVEAVTRALDIPSHRVAVMPKK